MIRSGSILVTGETVFGRRLSGHLFKGGTEAALTAETGLEADILDGDLRKVQKIFCIVYRVRITYSCGENPVSFLKRRLK